VTPDVKNDKKNNANSDNSLESKKKIVDTITESAVKSSKLL